MEKWTKEERKAIGSRMQKLRKKKGLLQEDLANLVGLKVGTISKYEQGDRTPGIRQLSRIAEILECDICEIMTGENTPPRAAKITGRQAEPEAVATENPSHGTTPAVLPQSQTADTVTTDFDAFLKWLELSSIKTTGEAEENYLVQIGSKSFHLSEKELHRIMGFLKKQFLKIMLEMNK